LSSCNNLKIDNNHPKNSSFPCF